MRLRQCCIAINTMPQCGIGLEMLRCGMYISLIKAASVRKHMEIAK
jgi:hypothetical protein